MRPTPGWVWRRRAISRDTLWPGSWPPSPGFEPCAILIWISSARARYSGVTPKRPDATCLMRRVGVVAPEAAGAEPGRVLAALAAVRPAADRGSWPGPGSRGPPSRATRATWRRSRSGARSREAGSTSSRGMGSAAGYQVQQVVQLDRRPLVDQPGEGLVRVVGLAGDGPLQQVGGGHVAAPRRRPAGRATGRRTSCTRVRSLSACTISFVARGARRPCAPGRTRARSRVASSSADRGGKRVAMAAPACRRRACCPAEAADHRRRAGEAHVDDLGAQTERPRRSGPPGSSRWC